MRRIDDKLVRHTKFLQSLSALLHHFIIAFTSYYYRYKSHFSLLVGIFQIQSRIPIFRGSYLNFLQYQDHEITVTDLVYRACHPHAIFYDTEGHCHYTLNTEKRRARERASRNKNGSMTQYCRIYQITPLSVFLHPNAFLKN